MLTQIENTPDGYIVGVYLRDGAGNGHWLPLRNFGDRQGDAIEFRDQDVPDFSVKELLMLHNTFDRTRRYKRLKKRSYQITKF